MILTAVQLKNFRCHKDISLNFSESLNYIVGGNGQGKTAILEAIYYLCTTKSHNTNSDSEVLKFGEDVFEISGQFKDLVNDVVRIIYSSGENKKSYLQNGKHKHRLSEIIGNYPIVLLTPADHSITFGYPNDRRKFIDSIYCQASSVYLGLLIDYNKTVRQRTSLLNSITENRNQNTSELDAWTQQLLETGLELIEYRKTFQVALRFAEFFYLKEKTGKSPIFLLDDVFGELDVARSVRISENLRKVGQTFITLTDFTNISYLSKQSTDTVIRLMNGKAIYA